MQDDTEKEEQSATVWDDTGKEEEEQQPVMTGKPQITAYRSLETWKGGGACRYGYRACSILHAELCGLHYNLHRTLCESGCSFLSSQRNRKIGVGGLTEQIVAVTVTEKAKILSGTVSASEKSGKRRSREYRNKHN